MILSHRIIIRAIWSESTTSSSAQLVCESNSELGEFMSVKPRKPRQVDCIPIRVHVQIGVIRHSSLVRKCGGVPILEPSSVVRAR